MQIGTVSRFWFCRRSWGFKIYIRWNIVHFRKPHVRANKLDVQETDFSFTQFKRSWNYFSRCRFTHGWNSSSWSLGYGFWSVSFFTKPSNSTTPKIKYEETRRVTPHQSSTPKTKPIFQPSTTILIWVMLIMFCRTRSLLDLVRCCTFVRTTKQCFKWSSKAEVQQWDTYPEPTELLLTVFGQNQFEP